MAENSFFGDFVADEQIRLNVKKNRYIFLRFMILLSMIRKGRITLRKIINAFHCFLAYWLRLRKSAKSPFMINFELWNECNANCKFCRTEKGEIYDYNPSGRGLPIPKGKMPLEVFTEIVDQTKQYLLMAILYMNGEPLMYRDLCKAVSFASERGVATMIATNGMLLNQAKISELLTAGIDFIKVAVSGYSQETYSIQVRRGDIEKVKENIRTLVRMNREGKHGAVVMVDYILYEYNKHELGVFREFCSELGVMLNTRPGNRRGVEDIEPPRPEPPLPLKVPCDWLWKILSINWNGDIFACCDLPVWSNSQAYGRFETGKTRIFEIWNGPKPIAMRKIHVTQGRSAIPVCSVCGRQGTAFKF